MVSGPPCRRNEVLKEEYCFSCRALTCQDYEFEYREYGLTDIPCNLMIYCSSKQYDCVCKDGYLRNSKDICVPRSECEFLKHVKKL
nr:unnamed protein product [Callosobruchus analis]